MTTTPDPDPYTQLARIGLEHLHPELQQQLFGLVMAVNRMTADEKTLALAALNQVGEATVREHATGSHPAPEQSIAAVGLFARVGELVATIHRSDPIDAKEA